MARPKKDKDLDNDQPLQSDKQAAIAAALASIERAFGKGTMVRLGDQDAHARDIHVVPSGSIGLDIALGVGGFPRGRVVEVYGPESSGKTTIALHVIAETQKLGGIAAFVDAEHALDVSYARRLGVRTDDLLVSQPDNGEQALEIVDTLVRSNAVDIIVIDSVAALVPKSEIEGSMGDAQVGAQARLMSQALRKLTASISKSNTIVLFINQLRMKIGVMFGSPETTTGGQALKFYASLRLDVRRVGALKSGDLRLVERDIEGVAIPCREAGALSKVILETALLTDDEKITASTLARAAGADFVKTSTGFGPGGATAADVALMRRVVGDQMGVKASGGVRDLEGVKAMIAAGATRIGASAGVRIVQESRGEQPVATAPAVPKGSY